MATNRYHDAKFEALRDEYANSAATFLVTALLVVGAGVFIAAYNFVPGLAAWVDKEDNNAKYITNQGILLCLGLVYFMFCLIVGCLLAQRAGLDASDKNLVSFERRGGWKQSVKDIHGTVTGARNLAKMMM